MSQQSAYISRLSLRGELSAAIPEMLAAPVWSSGIASYPSGSLVWRNTDVYKSTRTTSSQHIPGEDNGEYWQLIGNGYKIPEPATANQALNTTSDVKFASIGVGTTTPIRKYHQVGGKFLVESNAGPFGQLQIVNPSPNAGEGEASLVMASNATANSDGSISPRAPFDASHIWSVGLGTNQNAGNVFSIGNVAIGSALTISSTGQVTIPNSLSVSSLQNDHISIDEAGNLTSQGSVTGANFGQANGVATLDSNGKVPIVQLKTGQANGLATLDSGGKIPASQLPSTVMEYLGTWNAATNTPQLSDGMTSGVVSIGSIYIVSTAGTVTFGTDNTLTFRVGDWVVYNGTKWERSSGSDGVVSVAGQTGAISTTSLRTALGLSAVATSGSYEDLLNKPSLATVATSGSYTDLLNRPTITPVVSITAAAYALLSPPTPGTLYLISG